MQLEVFQLYDRFTQVWVEEALRHRRGEERADRKYPVHCEWGRGAYGSPTRSHLTPGWASLSHASGCITLTLAFE